MNTEYTLYELAGLACLADIVRGLRFGSGDDSNISINIDLLFPSSGASDLTEAASIDKYMWELSREFYKNEVIPGVHKSINIIKSIHSILGSSKLLKIEFFLSLVQACLIETASEDFKNIVLNNLPPNIRPFFTNLCEFGWQRATQNFHELSEAEMRYLGNEALHQITGTPMPGAAAMGGGWMVANQEEPTEEVSVGR